MTDTEIRDWLRLLPDEVPASKLRVVANLLAHANEDRMSSEDRTACHRAAHLLHTEITKGTS